MQKTFMFGGSLLTVGAIIVLSALWWVGEEVEARSVASQPATCDIDAGTPAMPWAVSGTAWAECSIGYVPARQIHYFRAAQSGIVAIENTTPEGDAWLRLKNSNGFGDKKGNLTDRIPVGGEATADVVAGRWYALMLLGSGDGQIITGRATLLIANSAPVFAGATTTRSVVETDEAGVNIGEPVSATDADGDALTYSLGGSDAASFAIESASGQLKTSAALDYDSRTTYSVTVAVSDGKDSQSREDTSVDAVISVTIKVTADWDRAFLLTEANPMVHVQHDWGDGTLLDIDLIIDDDLPSLALVDYRPDTMTIGEDVTWRTNGFGSSLRRARFMRPGFDDFVIQWSYERRPEQPWAYRAKATSIGVSSEDISISDADGAFTHGEDEYTVVGMTTYGASVLTGFTAGVVMNFRNLPDQTLYRHNDALALVVDGERFDFGRASVVLTTGGNRNAKLEWFTDRKAFGSEETVSLQVVRPVR